MVGRYWLFLLVRVAPAAKFSMLRVSQVVPAPFGRPLRRLRSYFRRAGAAVEHCRLLAGAEELGNLELQANRVKMVVRKESVATGVLTNSPVDPPDSAAELPDNERPVVRNPQPAEVVAGLVSSRRVTVPKDASALATKLFANTFQARLII